MAQKSGPFDSTTVVEEIDGFPRGDRAITAEELAAVNAAMISNGVAKKVGDGFRVTADGIPKSGFYQYEKAATRDAYGVFFGGNFREIQIDRGETDDRPVLYVIKDSYANAVLPLLSLHFRIRAFDPRYGAPVLSDFSGDCAGVLLLCGTQTLSGSAFF